MIWTDRRARLVAAGGIISLLAFAVIALLIRARWSPLLSLDVRTDDNLNRIAVDHHWLVSAAKDVSTILSPGVVRGVGLLIAALLLWRRRKAMALVVAAVLLGTLALSPLTKDLVDRARPHVPVRVATAGGPSYPSGHALASFVACALAVLLCGAAARRWVLPAGVLVAVAVGFSRMVLGVHYLSDVVGAWLLGTASICLVLLAVFVARRSRSTSPDR